MRGDEKQVEEESRKWCNVGRYKMRKTEKKAKGEG